MASRFYAVDKGQMMPKDVTEGAATATKGVEVQIDLAKVTSKLDAIQCLEAITSYIATIEFNPIS
jgi:hypothetical protein